MRLRKEDIPNFIFNAFPEYKGENFEVDVSEDFSIQGNSDGSKREYRLVSLVTGEVTNRISFSYDISRNNILIPRNIVVVKHEISCGKDWGLFITVRSENVNYLAIENKDIIMEVATQYKIREGMKEYFKSGKEEKILLLSVWM